MNKGGNRGGNGGRGGQGGNGGNGGPNDRGRGRPGGRGPAQPTVRFPSDHSYLRDNRSSETVRFPSDSNNDYNDSQYSLLQRVREERPGRGYQGQHNTRDPQRNVDGNRAPDSRRMDGGPSRGPQPQESRHPRREPRPPGRPHPERARGPMRDDDDGLSGGPAPREIGSSHIKPFELFCAYHLGITADDGYKACNIVDVARRFGVSPGVIKQALCDHQMDPDTVINSDFDMAMAQVDIQLAPAGVSKTELARGIFDDYLNAKRGARDWSRQLADDAAANARVFGNKG